MILAAGLSIRYGGAKQLAPVGPSGEALLDYGVCDARRAGFGRVVLVVREEQEDSFREHAARRWGGAVDVRYALQSRDRAKPWGTAHAVLAAAGHVGGPFAVINADDFYGAASFALLADHLRGVGPPDDARLALVGYRLEDTLSDAGGVSRGICQVNAEGYLTSVTEVHDIRRVGGGISGTTVAGEPLRLGGDEIASMNLWGCTPAVFPMLERRFASFLDSAAADPDAEFLLASAVSAELADGGVSVRVIPSPDSWFGMTFAEDRDLVAARLAELVSRGDYPDNLSAWFRTHGGTR